MAKSAGSDSTALPVRGVYLYFKLLEAAGKLDAFLAECDKKGLTFEVDKKLYVVGERHFSRPTLTEAAGPSCPACPGPPPL